MLLFIRLCRTFRLVVEVLSLQATEPKESPSVTIGLHAEPVTKADAALLQAIEPMESPSVPIGLHVEPVTKADAALSDETDELARVRLFHNGIISITITTHAYMNFITCICL